MICELKNLESLDLHSWDKSNIDNFNLYKLEKLKRLRVYPSVSQNILDHMKFGVFQDLEELYVYFKGASVESVQEMNRITPNLKKVLIYSAPSDTINALLETLKNLESVEIEAANWEVDNEIVCSNIKHLKVSCGRHFKFSAEHFTQQFPNLEYLRIYECSIEVTEPFFATLLAGLKRLKKLEMWINCDYGFDLDLESVLQWFNKYGKQCEDVRAAFTVYIAPKVTVEKYAISKCPGELFYSIIALPVLSYSYF
jgi:hypothetical protein